MDGLELEREKESSQTAATFANCESTMAWVKKEPMIGMGRVLRMFGRAV
jgi:hypothetical protein